MANGYPTKDLWLVVLKNAVLLVVSSTAVLPYTSSCNRTSVLVIPTSCQQNSDSSSVIHGEFTKRTFPPSNKWSPDTEKAVNVMFHNLLIVIGQRRPPP